MEHRETERLLEGVVVSVVVKKRVSLQDAEGGDETVDGPAHRATARAERPVVFRSRDREFHAARVEQVEAPHPYFAPATGSSTKLA
jgi:hypothetical protein